MGDRVVYLHELDSVRNSSEEIRHAQRVLFEEIVSNGSKVVLSFNQLTDSRAFISLIQDDKSYSWIKELFSEGILRFSLFGRTRTASQYVQGSLEKCLNDDEDGVMQNNTFYFSALPLKTTEENLNKCMLEALKYDDVELLQKRFKENADELFEDKEDKGDKPDILRVNMSREERIRFLTRHLELILFISKEKFAANPPKTSGTTSSFLEYTKMARKILESSGKESYAEAAEVLSEVERIIKDKISAKISELDGKIQALKTSAEKDDEEGKLAKKRISELEDGKGEVQKWIINRSVWYKHLRDMFAENPSRRESLEAAEAAVDVCYNIQVEYSINNVLKHYIEGDDKDFAAEFLRRLSDYLNPKNGARHKFLEPESAWEETKPVQVWDKKGGFIRNILFSALIGAVIGVLIGLKFGVKLSALPWTITITVLIGLLWNNTDRISLIFSTLGIPYSGHFARWATAARIRGIANKGDKGVIARAVTKAAQWALSVVTFPVKWIYCRLMKINAPKDENLYEYSVAKSKKLWKWELVFRIFGRLFLLGGEGFLWYRAEKGLETVQGYGNGALFSSEWFLSWLMFGVVFFGVNWILSIFGIPEISDIIRGSFATLWDAIVIRHAPAGEAYTRKQRKE